MQTLLERLSALRRDDGGQDLIEYAVLLGLIALSSTVLIPDLGGNVRSIYGRAAVALHMTSDRESPSGVRTSAGPIVGLDHQDADERKRPTVSKGR